MQRRSIFSLLRHGLGSPTRLICDAETQALFAAVMSFRFGNRTLSKLRERRG